jgi:hypothetical protein
MKCNPPEAEDGTKLTGQNFAQLSRREDMTENRLRTGQNRFLLYRSYTEESTENIFQQAKKLDNKK